MTWTRESAELCRTLGVRYPIVQAPMAGGPGTPALVAAVSESGGLGSIGAGYMTADELRAELTAVQDLTSRPIAVNLFCNPTPIPGRLTDDARAVLDQVAGDLGAVYDEDPQAVSSLEAQVDVALDASVLVVSFTFGVPSGPVIERLRSAGVVLVGTATSVAEARAVAAAGCDLVVAQGFEAGAHRGSFLDPQAPPSVGTLALVPQVVDAVDVPVLASGGIADGRGVTAALALGAHGVQIGTGFMAAAEAGTHPDWLAAIQQATDTSSVVTRAFTGRYARGIRNDFIDRMAPVEADLPEFPLTHLMTGPLRSAAKAAGRAEFMSLWAGQASSLMRAGTAAEILEGLIAEVEHTIAALHQPEPGHEDP